MIKSKRMRGASHVVHRRKMRNVYRSLVRKSEGKDHVEDLGKGWILGNVVGRCGGLDSSGLG